LFNSEECFILGVQYLSEETSNHHPKVRDAYEAFLRRLRGTRKCDGDGHSQTMLPAAKKHKKAFGVMAKRPLNNFK